MVLYFCQLPTKQRRIVAKVESLLFLCDALAAEVTAAEEVREQLREAVSPVVTHQDADN